jgi:hypothetical protein
MAISSELRAQMDAAVGKKNASKLTPEMRVQMDAAVGRGPVPVEQPQGPSFLETIAKPFTKTLATGIGAVEGAGRLAVGALTGGGLSPEEIQRAGQAVTQERSFGPFGSATAIGAKPQSTGQFAKEVVGTGLELGSYLAPVGGVAKGATTATKLLPKIGEAAKVGAGYGALAGGMQAGGAEIARPDSTLGSVAKQTGFGALAGGAVGGVIPSAGVALRSGAGTVGKGINLVKEAIGSVVSGVEKSDLSSRLVNSVIKPLEKEFRFGRDPGRTVVEELASSGIKVNNRQQLSNFITQTKKSVGQEIESVLTSPLNSKKKINIQPAINSIDKSIMQAAESGDELLMNRLQSVKNGLEYTYKQKGGRLVKSDVKKTLLTPKEAQTVKRQVGEAMRWTGQAFDADVNQARAGIYREIDKLIDNAVPGIDKLNDRYGGLLSAEKSIERTMNVGQRGQTLSMGDLVTGGLGGAAFGGPGAIISAVGRRFIESTPFKTRLAVLLQKHGVQSSLEELLTLPKEAQTEILKELPVKARLEVKTLLTAAEKAFRAFVVNQTSRETTPSQSQTAQEVPSLQPR